MYRIFILRHGKDIVIVMKVRIIVDSSADLIPEIKQQVTIVPLIITFGDEEYVDGVTLDHHQFYEKLIECEALPTTSQATPATFTEYFSDAVKAGEEVVVLTISSGLSGTYQSALIAAQEFEGKVFVVDSKTVALGLGILTQLALKLADNGMRAAEIAEKLTEERENVRLIALLDTLEYLKRGGRISKATALAGGLLSIKPIIEVKDGIVQMLSKARGAIQGNTMLTNLILDAGGVDFDKPYLLGYTGLTDEALKKYIEDNAELWQAGVNKTPQTLVSGVVGTHTGPGVVAAAFFKKN